MICSIVLSFEEFLSTKLCRIHCTYMGGYTSMEVTESTCQGTKYDEINLVSFKLRCKSPGGVGRCFIEVVL